jgi:hypothetical protein
MLDKSTRCEFPSIPPLVATSGERIKTTAADSAFAIARQPDGVGWFLFDDDLAREFDAWPHFLSTAPGIAYAYMRDCPRYRPDIIRSADTVAALARQCGIPAEQLERTVETARAHGEALAKPPFIALGPAPNWIATTEGGLAVDESLRVPRFAGEDDETGEPIPALHAAG